MQWEKDPKLQLLTEEVVNNLNFSHIHCDRIFCYRSMGATAHAYARIWSFPKIFQRALEVEPAYVIEFISEKFDTLKEDEKVKVIIHELLHIPKNFSGALLPHTYKNKIINLEVDRLYKMMRES